MKFFYTLFLTLLICPLFAQESKVPPQYSSLPFESQCDALCQAQKQLEAEAETVTRIYNQKLRDIAYQKSTLTNKQTEAVKVTFNRESAEYLKAIANLEFSYNLDVANLQRVRAFALAELTSKFKAKWELVIPKETLDKCTDRCPPLLLKN